MTAAASSSLLREKLLQSQLFRLYAQSFEMVTGYRLKLLSTQSVEHLSVPVLVGRNVIAHLVAEPVQPNGEFPLRGLLESFALQLGDESNRAALATTTAQPQAVKDVIAYLKDHLHGKVSLDEVADAVGICSFQICRLFKKHTGITMTEYMNRMRVERARKQLEDPGRPVAEIASGVGFSSLSQFNRNFLKFAGESPSEYRVHLKQLEHCQLSGV